MLELSELERQTGAVGAFIRERVVAEAEATTEERAAGAPEVRGLYDEYVKFCGEYNGAMAFDKIWVEGSQKVFARRFRETCLSAYRHRTSKTVEGKRVNVDEWLGVRVRHGPLWTAEERESIAMDNETETMRRLLRRYEHEVENLRENPWIRPDSEKLKAAVAKVEEQRAKVEARVAEVRRIRGLPP